MPWTCCVLFTIFLIAFTFCLTGRSYFMLSRSAERNLLGQVEVEQGFFRPDALPDTQPTTVCKSIKGT